MKLLNSAEVTILAHTQSGSQYRFREYERGKWEMLRDGDKNFSDRLPQDKWLHIQLLPVIEEGKPIVIWLAGGERLTTTPVTFIGRNN